ncbi:MAG: hypothetical protein IJX90_10150 [Blautia sp.]|nr:hypothetical protein [Blautia sp.]
MIRDLQLVLFQDKRLKKEDKLQGEAGQRYKLWEFVGGELCAEGMLDFATSFNISGI